jgi:hypothetical protein
MEEPGDPLVLTGFLLRNYGFPSWKVTPALRRQKSGTKSPPTKKPHSLQCSIVVLVSS